MKKKTALLLIFIGFFMSSCDGLEVEDKDNEHWHKYKMKNRELDYIIKAGNAKDKAELRLLIRTTDSILSNP